ncbi:MAG: cupredoxin domain-containing protein [Gammaproteobacteria bacterium]
MLATLLASQSARCEEMPRFRIEMKDGAITPLSLEVPANTTFKLELHNVGSTPVEFESLELHKEKVIAAGVTTFLVFRRLAPGEYKFFDDFHLDAPSALLIAK